MQGTRTHPESRPRAAGRLGILRYPTRRHRAGNRPSGATTTWTKSVWDGQQLVAELDSDGTRYTYVWGPDRTPLALKVTSGASSVTYAYHTDALGSVVAMTDESGSVVATYRYDPYGAVTHVGGTDRALA